MKERIFFPAGDSPALAFAAQELTKLGLTVADVPSTKVTHLLLDTPCKTPHTQIQSLLSTLNERTAIFGGFLDDPIFHDRPCFDLLKNEDYLAQNARITAQCAIRIAQSRLPITWDSCPVLVLGWGRIGKCLAQLLKALGAEVVIAVRRSTQKAMLEALGYTADLMNFPGYALSRYRVIFNTVPAPVLNASQLAFCPPECLKIDLASLPGMEAEDIIIARGLPGKEAPESSGRLIARTVLRLSSQKEADA